MNQARCSQCNAELPPEARFCRQCGTPVPASEDLSEMPTAVLSDKINAHSTQRLEPRTTSSEPRSFTIADNATALDTSKPRRRWVPATVIFGLVLLVLIGIVASVAYVRIRNNSRTSNALIYPGAKTIVDMNSSGGRAMQLETEDSLDRVVAWYDTTIKPTKTIRLTPANVVLKNDNVTVTVASGAGKTSILIKHVL